MLEFVCPTYNDYKGLIESSTTIAINIFGFLLTLLGLILQGTSETIDKMKSRKILYNRFIGFNKKVVIFAFIISIFGFLLKFNDNYFYLKAFNFIDQILLSLFFSIFGFLLVQTSYFIILFYQLLKNKNDS